MSVYKIGNVYVNPREIAAVEFNRYDAEESGSPAAAVFNIVLANSGRNIAAVREIKSPPSFPVPEQFPVSIYQTKEDAMREYGAARRLYAKLRESAIENAAAKLAAEINAAAADAQGHCVG